jgi:hypothetical protein
VFDGTITAAVGTPLTGVTWNVLSLQITAGWAGITGVGFTVTTIVNGTPGQLPDFAVTVYVNVATVSVVFVKVWVMLVCPTACALPPVTAPTGLLTGAVHVYVVPAGTTVTGGALAGLTVNGFPLQIV